MIPSNKITEKAYQPYRREALYCLAVDITVCVFIVLISVLLNMYLLLLMIPLFLLIELISNYRLALLSIIERKRSKYITRKLTALSVNTEWSASGHGFNSVIGKLYDKDKGVDRLKIIYRDEIGDKIKLRAVMGQKKYRKFHDIFFDNGGTPAVITYGKLTKIIIMIESSAKTDIKNDEISELNYMF